MTLLQSENKWKSQTAFKMLVLEKGMSNAITLCSSSACRFWAVAVYSFKYSSFNDCIVLY